MVLRCWLLLGLCHHRKSRPITMASETALKDEINRRQNNRDDKGDEKKQEDTFLIKPSLFVDDTFHYEIWETREQRVSFITNAIHFIKVNNGIQDFVQFRTAFAVNCGTMFHFANADLYLNYFDKGGTHFVNDFCKGGYRDGQMNFVKFGDNKELERKHYLIANDDYNKMLQRKTATFSRYLADFLSGMLVL